MTYTQATADELRRAVFLRADELQELARHLRGPLPEARHSLRDALDLVEQVPDALRSVVTTEWDRNPQADSRAQILMPLLRHANGVADFVEEHLAHGTRRELSQALVEEITRELYALGLDQYEVVVAHGPANNFITKHGDFNRAILGPVTQPGQAGSPSAKFFAFFKVPRIEGSGIFWRPVLLGHEVAHITVQEQSAVAAFDLGTKFDLAAARTLANPLSGDASNPIATAMGLYRIAEAWTTELLCDANAAYRYGPAGVAALAEYLLTIGGMESLSPTHPPGILRVRLLLNALGTVTEPALQRVLSPWSDMTPNTPSFTEPWAQYLGELFTTHAAALWTTVASFPVDGYEYESRTSVLIGVSRNLEAGVPSPEVVHLPDDVYVGATDADVVNAAWIARCEDASTPVDALGRKSVETLEFVRRWIAAGGVLPPALFAGPAFDAESESGVLSEDLLKARLASALDESRLEIRPLLQEPKGAGLDLRLGNRFIVFRRTSTASFDPLAAGTDPRSMQTYVELSWSEQLVLHPLELVLGATLEYLVIPPDLTAQVITRSSYGRLGLLSATAVQVHPRFRGCLTLELVNLSTIPLSLTPGERIAQLVISRTEAVSTSEDKYSCPIGPQFSKVRDDAEANVLRWIRGQD